MKDVQVICAMERFYWLPRIRKGLKSGYRIFSACSLIVLPLDLNVYQTVLPFITQCTVLVFAAYFSTALKSVRVLFVLQVRNKKVSFPICHVFVM